MLGLLWIPGFWNKKKDIDVDVKTKFILDCMAERQVIQCAARSSWHSARAKVYMLLNKKSHITHTNII